MNRFVIVIIGIVCVGGILQAWSFLAARKFRSLSEQDSKKILELRQDMQFIPKKEPEIRQSPQILQGESGRFESLFIPELSMDVPENIWKTEMLKKLDASYVEIELSRQDLASAISFEEEKIKNLEVQYKNNPSNQAMRYLLHVAQQRKFAMQYHLKRTRN